MPGGFAVLNLNLEHSQAERLQPSTLVLLRSRTVKDATDRQARLREKYVAAISILNIVWSIYTKPNAP